MFGPDDPIAKNSIGFKPGAWSKLDREIMAKQKQIPPGLSPLENAVMQVVWQHGSVKADQVRVALEGKHTLKNSTIRTILRRLEAKGVLEHRLEGRAFLYRPKVEPTHLAAKAVRGIADRFCQGSVSSLLLGMVNDRQISADELRHLADQIELAEVDEKKKSKATKKKKR